MRFALIIILGICAGCWNDAAHVNPLYPRSPYYENAGSIGGIVRDRSFNGLPGVDVHISPNNFSVSTDASGAFRFDALAPGIYVITLSGSDVEAYADTIAVSPGETQTLTYGLNVLPRFVSVALMTVHVSRWWPQQDLFRLDAVAQVADPDGTADIAHVDLQIPHLSLSVPMQPTPVSGFYSLALTEADMGGATLHSLLGRQLTLVVSDQPGAAASSGPAFLSRIIDYEPLTASPSGSQEVPGGSPLLQWEAASIPFAHTFQVDVYRVDDDIATIVYSEDEIPDGVLSTQVVDVLATGQYYWTLSVVDEFGNRSRSREAGFIVP